MRKPRTFTAEFKRQVVEEVLSGTTGPAQICRRHSLSSGLVYHWKKQYARGKLNNEPTQEEALLDRINKLEQMLGKLTQKMRVFKKKPCRMPSGNKRKISSLPLISSLSKVSKGDTN